MAQTVIPEHDPSNISRKTLHKVYTGRIVVRPLVMMLNSSRSENILIFNNF